MKMIDVGSSHKFLSRGDFWLSYGEKKYLGIDTHFVSGANKRFYRTPCISQDWISLQVRKTEHNGIPGYVITQPVAKPFPLILTEKKNHDSRRLKVDKGYFPVPITAETLELEEARRLRSTLSQQRACRNSKVPTILKTPVTNTLAQVFNKWHAVNEKQTLWQLQRRVNCG